MGLAVLHDALEGLEAFPCRRRCIGPVGIPGICILGAEAGQSDCARRADRVLAVLAATQEPVAASGGDEHGGLAEFVPCIVVEVRDAGSPTGSVGSVGDGGHPFGDLVGVGKELLG